MVLKDFAKFVHIIGLQLSPYKPILFTLSRISKIFSISRNQNILFPHGWNEDFSLDEINVSSKI